MKFKIIVLVALFLAPLTYHKAMAAEAASVPVNPKNSFEIVDVQAILRALPDGERWLTHLQDDLLKFWAMDTALGDPLG
ncbi:MAG: hypothetical protein P8X63_02040, partial [Desulfuromonadaceae bacterium]